MYTQILQISLRNMLRIHVVHVISLDIVVYREHTTRDHLQKFKQISVIYAIYVTLD